MPSTARSAADAADTVPRFARAVRLVHWSVAVLMFVCIGTAAILYLGPFETAVGHRRVVELIHVYCGIALPVPILIGLASRALRDDARRLNRFLPSDRRWLRSKTRRDGKIRVGKYNAGQKLNAALSVGAIAVLLGTGLLMFYTGLVRLSWRSGATFVHDWFALGLGILVLAHTSYGLRDPEAMQGMWTGRVPRWWAVREHAAWADEIDADPEHAQQGDHPAD